MNAGSAAAPPNGRCCTGKLGSCIAELVSAGGPEEPDVHAAFNDVDLNTIQVYI